MKPSFAWLLAPLLLLGNQQSNAGSQDGRLSLNQTAGHTYHHLAFTVSRSDFAGSGPWMGRDLAYWLSDRGQFEIYLNRDGFPVQAPDCNGPLIVRMPWTDDRLAAAEQKISEKKRLLDQLSKVRDGDLESLDIVLELDPYLRADRTSPLGLQLTGCTLFFRHADGRYIPHDGPLGR